MSGRKGVRRLDGDAALLGPGGGAEQADLPDGRLLAQEGGDGRADHQEDLLGALHGASPAVDTLNARYQIDAGRKSLLD